MLPDDHVEPALYASNYFADFTALALACFWNAPRERPVPPMLPDAHVEPALYALNYFANFIILTLRVSEELNFHPIHIESALYIMFYIIDL